MGITYRNLFKKVTLLMNSHQISVDAYTTALRLMKVEDIDNDETACILANLIYKGRIKGYISHQHNKLHLCKPLIRAVESSALKDRFSKSQLVTYKYFVGRKYMFDNQLKEAEEYL